MVMAYNPEDVGSKPTTGNIFQFACFTETGRLDADVTRIHIICQAGRKTQ